MTERLPELLDSKALQAELGITRATTVYIARGKRGVVLYVGITGRNLRRMHRHARAAAWWPLATRLELRHLATKDEALALERELIEKWEPEFNTQHNGRGKERERAAAGLFTTEGIALQLGWPISLARVAARSCEGVTFGQTKYFRLDDVREWFDRTAVVVPPEARA